MSRIVGCLAAFVCVSGAGLVHAQAVQGEATVTLGQPPQGQVVVQQPYGYPQQQPPPPGYGQVYAQPQPYVQQPYVQPQPYYQPQPQPQYVERSESITGLWVTGVVLFPVSWVLTWTFTMSTLDSTGRDPDYTLWSWVPLIGPWFMLGQGDDGRGLNESEIGGAVLSGIVQAASLTMIILGLALRRTVRVAAYALDDSERAPQIELGLAPAYGGGMLSATLTHF